MKYRYIIYVQFLLSFLACNLHSQSAPYIIGEIPSIFSTLENQLEQDEIDSVLILCDKILKKESDARIKGIAYFYKGQAATMLDRNNTAIASFEDARKKVLGLK